MVEGGFRMVDALGAIGECALHELRVLTAEETRPAPAQCVAKPSQPLPAVGRDGHVGPNKVVRVGNLLDLVAEVEPRQELRAPIRQPRHPSGLG